MILLLLAISCSYGTAEEFIESETNRAKQQMAAEDNILHRFFGLRGQNSDGSEDFSTLAEANKRQATLNSEKQNVCSLLGKIVKLIESIRNETLILNKICEAVEYCYCDSTNCQKCLADTN